jgi:hypothetical protein
MQFTTYESLHSDKETCLRRFQSTLTSASGTGAESHLIAEFYVVDRGLRHRLPGFPSLDRLVVLRRVSAGSGTNGHTAVVVLRGRLPVSVYGSIGIVPI